MKKRKTNFNRVVAFGVAVLLSLGGSAGSVFADNPVSGSPVNTPADAHSTLTKRVRVPQGLSIPGHTYTFTFVPGAVTDSDTPETSPAINNDTASLTDDNKLSLTFPAVANPTPATPDDGFRYAEASLTDFLNNTSFPHAGIYTYTVSEDAGTNPVAGGTMIYSNQQFKMIVYVINDSPGTKVKHVEFRDSADVKADLIFVNSYTKNTNLEISKEVAGDYADLGKYFDFTIDLTKSPMLTSEITYTAKYYKADGSHSIVNVTTGTAETFTLKTGEKIVFEDDAIVGSTSLPVGTTYTLQETAYTNYAATANITSGSTVVSGYVKDSFGSPDKNKLVVIGSGGTTDNHVSGSTEYNFLHAPIVVADGTNKAAWSNRYIDPPTPTGIIMDNLPFILFILVAVGGFVGYIAFKRRRFYR